MTKSVISYQLSALGENFIDRYKPLISFCAIASLATIISWLLWGTSPALANLDDDRLDGNIYVVYAGNGSLVPPRLSLAESLKRKTPAILVYYLDDSRDCKQFAIVVSRLQEYYGRAASIIPISVDAIPVKSSYSPNEPGYYYEDVVPQTVVLDENGKVAFNGKGQVKYEVIDDALREIFDLLPRSESEQLKRRSFNEYNTELVD